MYGSQALRCVNIVSSRVGRGSLGFVVLCLAASLSAAEFSGKAALEYTRQAVALGPRPSGSTANANLQDLIRTRLKAAKCEVIDDAFDAVTPKGRVRMTNIIGRFKGTSGKAIVYSGHFDTKLLAEPFPGANDGGSSTGFLLAMADALAARPQVHEVLLVFFDGEEAVGDWTATDSIYGSRHLADKWEREGMLKRILAMVNVDMIGDKDLDILPEGFSSPRLRDEIWQIASQLGYAKYFLKDVQSIEDDHLPFARRGVNIVDLIDFDYPPWHTSSDTMDKLDANSFQVTGDVLLELLRRLEKR